VLREALRPQEGSVTPQLWEVVAAAKPDDPRLLPAASALALIDPKNDHWNQAGPAVSDALVRVNAVSLGGWTGLLQPVRNALTPRLASIFRDAKRTASERSLATNVIFDYAGDDPDLVAGLLMVADAEPYSILFPIAQRQESRFLPLFRAEIAKKAGDPQVSEDDKDQLAMRQARAAAALVRLGKADEVFPLLRHSSDPRLRSFILNWLNPLGADPHVLVAGLNRTIPDAKPMPIKGQQKMDAILFHFETSIRRALILVLGTYGTAGLSAGEREPLIDTLLDLYRNDPDAGIHGAAEWTLRHWQQQEKLKATQAELTKLKEWDGRRWYVNGQGQTFVIVDGPVEFRMGSPTTEPDRTPEEIAHRRVIPRRFAIAAKEVSVEQYQRFVNTNPQFGLDPSSLTRYSPDPSGPMIFVTWYGAAAYCNWLSEQEGLPKANWCYLQSAAGAYAEGMTIPANVLERTGYRLPTEAEWEFACRAGTTTSRYHGLSLGLLGSYARYQANSQEHTWPGGSLLPNDLGLFDMLGNVYEWCQDPYRRYQPGKDGSIVDHITITESISEKSPRLLRGKSFLYPPANVRSALRDWVAPAYRGTNRGFRPARTYP